MKTTDRSRAKEELVWVVRNAIVSGQLRPGQPLKEGDLALALGLSRTPVREALIVLEQTGLLTGNRVGRGWMVRVFTPEEVHEVLVTRAILEGAAAGLLIERLTGPEIERLRGHLHEERAALDAGRYRQIKLDGWKFHTEIVEMAGNLTLMRCFNMLRDQIRFLIIQGPASLERMQASHREHWEILQAIERRDPARARQCVERHFAAAEAALLANPGSLFDASVDVRTLFAKGAPADAHSRSIGGVSVSQDR
jgi:DNA-binding GntR family transcriptional regulator